MTTLAAGDAIIISPRVGSAWRGVIVRTQAPDLAPGHVLVMPRERRRGFSSSPVAVPLSIVRPALVAL